MGQWDKLCQPIQYNTTVRSYVCSHQCLFSRRTDERVRTKLYLYRLCRARRRKTKSNRRERRVPTENYVSRSDWRKNNYNGKSGKITEKTEKATCSVLNSISGIIMIIMIISFRDKRNTDWPDQTDTRKRMSSSSFLVISFYLIIRF